MPESAANCLCLFRRILTALLVCWQGRTNVNTELADIGIIGAGQLARMMHQAAIPLGIRVRILAGSRSESAAQVAPDVVLGSPDDPVAVANFAQTCRVVTFDHELVEVEKLERVDLPAAHWCPSPAVMRVSQSKRLQRECFTRLGLPLPRFCLSSSEGERAAFIKKVGFPLMVKADRGGYDGRGVWKAEDTAEFNQIIEALASRNTLPILEERVDIDRELAILVVRNPSGAESVYPLVQTVQSDGILRELIAPAPESSSLVAEAGAIALTLARALEVDGILAVELFQSKGKLLVNEIASRPHNSGHYTIEGCETSQFEQHLRASLDWPLGATAMISPVAVTVNLIGRGQPALDQWRLKDALAVKGVHIHVYGKEPRVGRKIGHVTALGYQTNEVLARARIAASILNED
jgi:5-(carboxyamino)imidazole ribonucleotide synthase